MPDAPTDVVTLLWVVLGVVVSGASGVILYLWRALWKTRDQREKDLRDLLAQEKAESKKQQDLLERNTNTLDSILKELMKKGTK